jgi:ferrous iron transport protein B
MAATDRHKIALVGNPNSGKTSLFNQLTGLNQKIGNFPGVTVDKKTGVATLAPDLRADIIDLPGTYSLYPNSADEQIVSEILVNPHSEDYPDMAVVVVDASNMRRNLLLFTQVMDLGIPVVLALNMMDLAKKAGNLIDIDVLSKSLGVPVVAINARNGQGLQDLKQILSVMPVPTALRVYQAEEKHQQLLEQIREKFGLREPYAALQLALENSYFHTLPSTDQDFLRKWKQVAALQPSEVQKQETLQRYTFIDQLLKQAILSTTVGPRQSFSRKLDKILLHKVWGYVVFFVVLFLIFQAIFAWAEWPMDLIDGLFGDLSGWLSASLPEGALTDMLANGIVPGIGGILIFIPQIAILFAFISLLEESGYMARVVFLMDKIMRKFGLNGKSVVPLISGIACAIPAIMATRTIDNWKERLITIMVTPLMSCSARLPIYAILIALVVPDTYFLGFLNLQGIALMAMYLLGFVAALGAAVVMKWLLKTREKSFLLMELPTYKLPRWKNVGYNIYEKTQTFVLEAGKVIIAISIVLWVLASYGPGDRMDMAEVTIETEWQGTEYTAEDFENRVAAYRLENSYAGVFGKTIEPVLEPLGFDWKIGIALLTSFAAREVFVGTMSTIYSLGGTEEEGTVKSRMEAERHPVTGEPLYTAALGFSLMVFYAFAMQCMSTLAVVYRETKGWKWPLIQFVYMTGLAYVASFIVYQALS